MKKKFKCQSCHHEFTADMNNYVTCPKCESDNVMIVKERLPLRIIAIVVGAIIVLTAAIVIIYHKEYPPIEPPASPTDTVLTPDPVLQVDTLEMEFHKLTIIWEKTAVPVYDNSSETYSFSVHAQVVGNQPGTNVEVEYVLKRDSIGPDIAKNSTGDFSKVPPVRDGKYIVEVRAFQNGKLSETESTNVDGCVIVPKSIVKMTVAEVQQIINKKDLSVLNNNERIAPVVRIICQGDLGEESAPTSLAQVISHIRMDIWGGVTVKSVGYDGSNRVNQVVITPILPD